jgi:hypothetical protein
MRGSGPTGPTGPKPSGPTHPTPTHPPSRLTAHPDGGDDPWTGTEPPKPAK